MLTIILSYPTFPYKRLADNFLEIVNRSTFNMVITLAACPLGADELSFDGVVDSLDGEILHELIWISLQMIRRSCHWRWWLKLFDRLSILECSFISVSNDSSEIGLVYRAASPLIWDKVRHFLLYQIVYSVLVL